MNDLVLTPGFERAFRRLVGKNPKTGGETLLLINLGSHDEVY